MSKQCGCKSPKPLMMPQEHCPFIPEYLDGACGVCGGDQSFGKGECVTLCDDIDGQPYKFIYKSLEDNNTTHPRMGKWQKLTLCEIINMVLDTPEATVDTNTTYTIQNNDDGSQDLVGSDGSIERFHDKYCTSSAVTNPQTGATIVSRTCYKSDGTVESGPTPYLTIEAGAVDTINGISIPDSDGCITITRPDLSTERVPTCEALKCSKAKPFSAKRVLNSIFRQNLTNSDTTTDLERDVKTLAFEVTDGVAVSPAVPPFTVVEHVLDKDDFCAGDCDYNGLRLQVHSRSNKQDTPNGDSSKNVITAYEVDGGFSEGDNVISAPTDGSDAINNEFDLIDMPFDSNGQITIRHIVQRFPALSEIDDGFSLLTVKARACVCLNTD